MEEERLQRHVDHVEKLTNEKEEFIKRIEELLERRRGIELNLKKMKDNFEEDFKRQKELWAKT